MAEGLAAQHIDTVHWQSFAEEARAPCGVARADALALVWAGHAWNRLLWAEEEQARRLHVPDAAVATHKRAIDVYNRARRECIESFDELLLRHRATPRAGAWLNSESAGSLVDRLSINALRVFHASLLAERHDSSEAHSARCRARLTVLCLQRHDLLGCLQRLLDGLRDGSCEFRLHRQLHMHHEALLHPPLDAAPGRGEAAGGAGGRH